MSTATRLYLDNLFSGGRSHGCWMCGVMLKRATATADHLMPQSIGGSDGKSNLRPCCWTCNNGRGNRPLTQGEWAKAHAWQPTPEKVSKRVLVLKEVVSKFRRREATAK